MTKILVVEDNPGGRGLVAALLRSQGHDVLETANGVMALTATRREQPALIILDINMPVMDGFEFLQRLRAEPEIAGVRVLLYTSTSDLAGTQAKAASFGVTTILPKSAPPDVILDAVNKELSVTAGVGKP
ncbi:MAG: response regulator [Rhodospirillaceae bacterium]